MKFIIEVDPTEERTDLINVLYSKEYREVMEEVCNMAGELVRTDFRKEVLNNYIQVYGLRDEVPEIKDIDAFVDGISFAALVLRAELKEKTEVVL